MFLFEVKIPVSTKHLSPEKAKKETNKQTRIKLRTPDLDTAKPMALAAVLPAEQFCALSLLKGTTSGGIQTLQVRAFLCYGGCKQGTLKPTSHLLKDKIIIIN